MSLYEQLKQRNQLNKNKGLREMRIIRVISNTHGGYRVKPVDKMNTAHVYTIPGDKLAEIIIKEMFYIQNFSMCVKCKDKAFKKFKPDIDIKGYDAATGNIDIDKFNLTIHNLEGVKYFDFEDLCDYIGNFYTDVDIWEDSSTTDKSYTVQQLLDWLLKTKNVAQFDDFIEKLVIQ